MIGGVEVEIGVGVGDIIIGMVVKFLWFDDLMLVDVFEILVWKLVLIGIVFI